MLPKIGEKNYILWQPSWQNCRGELRKKKLIGILATKLPKIGEKKYIMATKLSKLLGRREKLLGILACQKWRGDKKNCGNEVAENWRSHSTLSYSYSPKTLST